MAKTYMIPARYMEQNALEAFLGRLFGYGKAQVTVSAPHGFYTMEASD